VGLGDFRHIEALSQEFLPSVLESLLFLADRLMNRALQVRYYSFLNQIKLGSRDFQRPQGSAMGSVQIFQEKKCEHVIYTYKINRIY